ncbi:MAG: ATP-dependent DNA ligase [Christensenellales bacterium]
MEPISTPQVVREDGFIHQIKWDGIRGIANVDNGNVTIYTKKGFECTASYPEMGELPQLILARQAVLDGEIVVFADGKPSFYHALRRNRTRSSMGVKQMAALYPIRYIVFDLLFLNKEDKRSLPLKERQEILKSYFVGNYFAAPADSFEDGQALFSLMRQKNMEGIVSKRISSSYLPGKKHTDWYKTKTAKKLLCVVVGIQLKNAVPASLVLGVYRDGALTGVGEASSGLRQSDWTLLAEYMQRECLNRQKDIVWVRPTLTCWVRFAEWTQNGTLRHPVLLGFSTQDAKTAIGEEFCI